jgi:hypothetical protein
LPAREAESPADRVRDGDTKAIHLQIDLFRPEWDDASYHFDRNDPVAGWSKSQWQKHIRTLVSAPANVIFTDHALLRMRQRHISRWWQQSMRTIQP